MAEIVKTEMIVTSTDSAYRVDGDWTASALIANYSSQIPGLAQMSHTEVVEARPEGSVRVVTFAPRVGNKG